MAGLQRIAIDKQMAAVGISHTRARMNITQPRKSLRISQERAQFSVERVTPTFRVNRRKLNAEMNLHTPGDFSRQFRDEGRAGVQRGIRRTGDEADFIGDLRNRGDRIAQVTRNRAMSSAMRKREVNLGLMPRERPEITWDTGSMSINWTRHSLVIDWDGEHMPQITVDPKHSVEVFLRREPYFRIRVEEVISPGRSGQVVDHAI